MESAIDKKLHLWKKLDRIENGEAIQFEWQFVQTRFIITVFWQDGHERVALHYLSPRNCARWAWDGLSEKTFNKLMDRVGNLAQATMYPPSDWLENG